MQRKKKLPAKKHEFHTATLDEITYLMNRKAIDENNKRVMANKMNYKPEDKPFRYENEMLPDGIPLNVIKSRGAYRVQNIVVCR